MIPSNNWKIICGQTNHLCTVIIHKMIEREMDYRVSKSVSGLITPKGTVKEQRVDGRDRDKILPHLSYTLAGFERNNQIKILSNQIKILKRFFSVDPKQSLLHPRFVTGFSDAESNFLVVITKSNTMKLGWTVQLCFQIGLHKKDLDLLKKIKSVFGVGEIYNKSESCNYMVRSLADLNVILDHFEKYPLLTKKREDFELFTRIFKLIEQKQHLTVYGLHEIISIKAAMNYGRLSEHLKNSFPNIIPAKKSIRLDTELLNLNLNPHWVVGFTAGEGSFSIGITKSLTVKTGFQVQLRFQITQHSTETALMKNFICFFGCGKVFKRSNEDKVDFIVRKFEDLVDKVIPVFKGIPLQGVKSKDFSDFLNAVEIIKAKKHLTCNGLDELRKIKQGMNKGRWDNKNLPPTLQSGLFNIFICKINLTKAIQLIDQLKGYYYINPLLSLSLGITLFSFAGIPPLIGFFGKQMILSAAIDNGYIFMVLVAILTSVISAVYYLTIIKQIFFDPSDYTLSEELNNFNSEGLISEKNTIVEKINIKINNIVISSSLSMFISVITLVITLFMFIPEELLNLANILALILFNL